MQVGSDKVHNLMLSLIQLDEEKIMKSCSELEILLETLEVYETAKSTTLNSNSLIFPVRKSLLVFYTQNVFFRVSPNGVPGSVALAGA